MTRKGREIAMNVAHQFASNGRLRRVSALSVGFAALALLTACGGGGGSNPPPPPPPAPVNGTITLGAITPGNGAVSVTRDGTLIVNYTISTGTLGPVNGTLGCGGANIPLMITPAGAQASFDPEQFMAYGTTCTFQGNATAKGSNGGTDQTVNWNIQFTVEARPVLRYSVIYGLSSQGEIADGAGGTKIGPGYPVRFKGASCATMSIEFAKNETGYDGAGLHHVNTWLYGAKLPSGRVLSSAQMLADGFTRRATVLDPVTNTLKKYEEDEGVTPSMTAPVDPGWVAQSPDHPDPKINFFAELGDLMIYVGDDNRVIRCRDAAGDGVLTNGFGGFYGFVAYSN